ncbi:MAG TPA: glycosyltransferase [Candidatus Dormibacteraeota bacterium]|nr:glycosyltransferase [Candidatus Dormibacteraeota bacterium]
MLRSPATEVGKQIGDSLDISVVIPCLNESRTVGACVEAALDGIRSAGLSGEVIVADNGSTDGSRKIAEGAGAQVVPVPRRGYGAALDAGFQAARGRLLVMGDADLSYDFRELPKLVAEQERTNADIVLGDRLHGVIKPGAMPWTHHYIGNPLISLTIRRLFHAPVNDCYCGLRLLTKDAYARLRLSASSMEYALEMIVQGSLLGLRFAQVPITLHVDGRDRAPHLRTVQDGYRSFRFLFQHAPITAYIVPGLIAAIAGAVLLARAAWIELRGSISPEGASTGAALLVIGWQLAVFGVIARTFVAGFIGGEADSPLRSFYRFLQLERTVAGAVALQVVALVLLFGFRSSPVLLELGLALSIIAVGTFVGSFLVSLIGRAMPYQKFDSQLHDVPEQKANEMAEADQATRQNIGHSLATQHAISHAPAYNAWLVDSLREAWEGSSRVLDVGCSIGNVTHVIADRLSASGKPHALVVGVEIIPEAAREFKERFAGRTDLDVVCADILSSSKELDEKAPFDSAVSFNVLEHLEDDVAALRAMAKHLKPGGKLGLLVPGGGNRLYGTLDSLDRHYRRYTQARLEKRLRDAGYEVIAIRKVNMLGAILWYIKGRVIRSQRFDEGEVKTFDRLVPFLRRLDAFAGPPFGQSLAAVARVPAGATQSNGRSGVHDAAGVSSP